MHNIVLYSLGGAQSKVSHTQMDNQTDKAENIIYSANAGDNKHD